MPRKKPKNTDAIAIIHRRHYAHRPERETSSVICRLEDADYEGHSLAMLQRIAAALNKRVEIRFVSRRAALHTA